MFDTRLLVTFQHVVDTGSFSGAARALRCSQPSVSQQIRILERSGGGPLFVRSGRGIVLTEIGKALARHTEVILPQLAKAEQEVRAIASIDGGTVRVCAFPSANATLLPIAAQYLRLKYPGIRLELLEDEPPDSVLKLRQAECDLVISFTYDQDPQYEDIDDADGLTHIPLARDRWLIAISREHQLATKTTVGLSEFFDEPWISGCERCRLKFVSVCHDHGFEPDIVHSTDDNLALQGLVAAGLGAAVIPKLVLPFLQSDRVSAIELTPRTERTIEVWTLPDLVRVDSVRATIKAIEWAAKKLGLPGSDARSDQPSKPTVTAESAGKVQPARAGHR